MTKSKKRRKPSGYRDHSPAGKSSSSNSSDSQPGLLARFMGPATPARMSAMPLFRTTIGQGFLLVGSTPALVLVPFALVLVAWASLLVAGYVGSPATLAAFFAMPPVSIAYDTQNLVAILGQQLGIPVALGFLLVRSVIVALLAALIVEGFERGGSVSTAGSSRGLRAVPIVAAALFLSFVGLLVGQFALFLGPGIGLLLQVFVPAALLYLFGFVPFAAVRHSWGLRETLRSSIAAARTPGGRHLTLSILYILAAFILPLFIPGRLVTANPAVATWIGILLVTYVQLGFTAGFAYRWMGVEGTMAPEAPRSAAPARRR